MSEHFEEVKTRIMKEAKGNGGPSNENLVDLIVASHADNAAEHKVITASLDKHVVKLDEMEERSLDIASGFAAVLVTPQFTALLEDRDRKVAAAISEHVVDCHQVDEEMSSIKRAWHNFKWLFVFIGIPVLIILLDQITHVIGGAS
jgi:hypothetical protein